jgi:hypothetical protein
MTFIISTREFFPGCCGREYGVIQFESSWAKKKSAVATVTPMVEDVGKWGVPVYYIK